MTTAFAVVALLAPGCAPRPQRIRTAMSAPEDMERITWQGRPALVVGAAGLSRRNLGGMLEVYVPGAGTALQPIYRGCAEQPFHPAGMCVVQGSRAPGLRGKDLLYTTSLLDPDRPTVAVFEITAKGLTRLGDLGPVPGAELINGLAASADGSVYVTVMDTYPTYGLHLVTDPGKVQRTGKNRILTHGPDGEWRTVASGINGANGLALSPDGRQLFVCEYHCRRVLCFPRDPHTNNLQSPAGSGLQLPFHPDNLKRDAATGVYEVCGQRSELAAGLNLFFGLPICRGGAAAFRWDRGGQPLLTADTPDRDRAARSDCRSPSTALRCGDFLYCSHFRNPLLTRIPLPQAP